MRCIDTYRLLDLLFRLRKHNRRWNLTINVRPSFRQLLKMRILGISQDLEIRANVAPKLVEKVGSQITRHSDVT